MRIKEETKKSIILYILNKIHEGCPTLTKTVSEVFEINRATVYKYMNELIEEGIIRKLKRDQYEIIAQEFRYHLERAKDELDEEADVYRSCFEEHIKNLSLNARGIWDYVFGEMVNNVIEHSEASELDLIIKQDYLCTEVRIIDDGIGIFNKIMKYFNLHSIDDAINELFKGKLTTDSEHHSGEGIFFSSKLVDEFFIISDNKVFTHNKYSESDIFSIEGLKDIGTAVIMRLSNYTKRHARDVFNQYSDEEGVFIRTVIPLGTIFDSNPVSRSQAKRICNRLDSFEEVVLDFENVEWMGQGFAHQIFKVFAKENPEIKLTPINMNHDVEKMYKHVILTKLGPLHKDEN